MGRMFDALQKVEREKNRESNEESPKIIPEDVVLDNKLVSFFAPSSMASEQFRRLRSYIIKPGMENSPKTILVTSAMAGEGKSLISINLAIVIATELHSHALLVDCDLRNPTLSRWFGFQEGKGLSDYLTGEASLPDLLVKTSVDKLSILPGGALPDNPVELIGSNKMRSFVADLKARYADRYIILDSSPLLATTEPSVLNQMVDGILLVIKSGDTPRESIQQALKLLDKKKIIGVVLNKMEFKTEAMIRRYFGSNRYYNDYHYDYGHSKLQPVPGIQGNVRSLARNMKSLFGKLLPGKKEDL
ncbi:MAG: polysaccharide biosynthesis tyrosine autokinase [Syntrophus sp. (in: bacteria)]